MNVCKFYKINYLICLDEEIKYVIVKNSDRMGNVKFVSPSIESYQTSFKENLSTAFAKKMGIPTLKQLQSLVEKI